MGTVGASKDTADRGDVFALPGPYANVYPPLLLYILRDVLKDTGRRISADLFFFCSSVASVPSPAQAAQHVFSNAQPRRFGSNDLPTPRHVGATSQPRPRKRRGRRSKRMAPGALSPWDLWSSGSRARVRGRGGRRTRLCSSCGRHETVGAWWHRIGHHAAAAANTCAACREGDGFGVFRCGHRCSTPRPRGYRPRRARRSGCHA